MTWLCRDSSPLRRQFKIVSSGIALLTRIERRAMIEVGLLPVDCNSRRDSIAAFL